MAMFCKLNATMAELNQFYVFVILFHPAIKTRAKNWLKSLTEYKKTE